MFRVNPNTYMTMNVPRIDVGMASRTLRVVDQEPRNTQQTTLVRSAARMRVKRISLIARSMKTVVSKLTARKSPSGSSFSISASRARTSRPTCTAFAPRSLVMPKPMAGWPLVRARRRLSSSPSSTTATSESRTGAPFR